MFLSSAPVSKLNWNFLGGVEWVSGEEVGVAVPWRWRQAELQIFTVYYNLIAALQFRCIEQPGSSSSGIKAIFFCTDLWNYIFFQSNVIWKKHRKATLEEKSCSWQIEFLETLKKILNILYVILVFLIFNFKIFYLWRQVEVCPLVFFFFFLSTFQCQEWAVVFPYFLWMSQRQEGEN